MLNTYKKKLGQWGEELAKNYLIEQGYRFIESNWQGKQGEIDLVMICGQDIVFVEVKTRTTPCFGPGESAVDFRKREKIRKTIDCYLHLHRKCAKMFPRFDIVVVEIFGLTPKFIHFENVALF